MWEENGTSLTVEAPHWAHPILIAWEAADIEIFTLIPPDEIPNTSSATIAKARTASGPSSTRYPSSTSNVFAFTDPPTPNKSDGLFTVAKAGIGVGISLSVVLLGVVLGVWLSRRWRNQSGGVAEKESIAASGGTGEPEYRTPMMESHEYYGPATGTRGSEYRGSAANLPELVTPRLR